MLLKLDGIPNVSPTLGRDFTFAVSGVNVVFTLRTPRLSIVYINRPAPIRLPSAFSTVYSTTAPLFVIFTVSAFCLMSARPFFFHITPPFLSFLSFSVKGRYREIVIGSDMYSVPLYLYDISAPVSGENVASVLLLLIVYPSFFNGLPTGRLLSANVKSDFSINWSYATSSSVFINSVAVSGVQLKLRYASFVPLGMVIFPNATSTLSCGAHVTFLSPDAIISPLSDITLQCIV